MKIGDTRIFGGIEGGGTKFVCAVGDGEGSVLADSSVPTTTPEETFARVVDFFQQQTAVHGPLASLGFASFGPLDLRPDSARYGRMLRTPKPGWTNVDLLAPLHAALGVPVRLDTDVNGAALGEWGWGAAQGLDHFIYLTIGTGIGGGGLVNGKLMRGLLHPEMGHIPLPRDERDTFESVCPFHSDCFEGLASAPAMAARWGSPADALPPGHPCWELEADYIALALRSLICTLSPQRIVIGGGVAQQSQLLPLVREKTLRTLNGYLDCSVNQQTIDAYIVPPALGRRAGVMGAIALARGIHHVRS